VVCPGISGSRSPGAGSQSSTRFPPGRDADDLPLTCPAANAAGSGLAVARAEPTRRYDRTDKKGD